MRKLNKVWLIVVLGLLVAAPPVGAASVEMAPTVKAAFDKMVASADSSLASRMTLTYQDLATLQTQNEEWDRNNGAIHADNSERLSQFSKEMKQLDAEKRQKLELEYKQTREKYEPLFNSYSALNKQIVVAKFFKSKEVNAALRAQAEAMKIPVQLAREDIKAKLDAWNAAKQSTADTVKRVRQTLAETKPLQDQIKAKKKSVTSLNGRFSEAWKGFSPAVKKADASAAMNALTEAVSISRQRNDLKESIYALEVNIKDILQRAKRQLD
ncbi:hypothetical protein [Gordoniibacillus kamchatkensis]|nr:hypothetical protein [Paenibacillus sp. VKM B-2647]